MKLRYILTILAVFSLLLFATLNKHRYGHMFNYHSEIFSDKAGYQVYLPATFLYGFNAKNFPDSIEFKTGEGYTLNRENGKVITKYPYGVALLQSPFFIITHLICLATNPNEATGYTRPYHNLVNIAAIVYLLLGLILMYHYLLALGFKPTITRWSLFFYLFGSNLYYYGIAETGLSHAYAFFATAALLFFSHKAAEKLILGSFLLTGLAGGLMVAIRPANLLFVPFVFLVGTNFKFYWLNLKNIVALLLGGLIFILPQLAYYHYLSGSWLMFSYGNESFSNLGSPKIKEVLFAFENGWLSNHPINLLGIIGLFILGKENKKSAISIGVVLAGVTYLYASWWSWKLGCGLGHRGFVDFIPLLLIPFTYLLNWSWGRPKIKTPLLILCFALVMLSLKLVYTYDGCWYGNSSWDFNEYVRLIISPTK